MTRVSKKAGGKRRGARGLAPIHGIPGGLFLLFWAVGSWGQDLPLPETAPSIVATSRRVEITWDEVEVPEGRAISNVQVSEEAWDPENSSTFELGGAYVLDCDYLLTISRIVGGGGPEDYVRLKYDINDNVAGVGTPVAVDTLEVLQPDVDYPLNPLVAGEVTIRFSANVGQPTGMLGSIPVSTSGLYAGIETSVTYQASALNSASVPPGGGDTLLVEVKGPLSSAHPQLDTLAVAAAGQRLRIMEGMEISFGEGSAGPGEPVQWSAHYLFPPGAHILAHLEAFEGYHLWRSDLPDLDSFTLLGEIRQCESKWDFVLLDEEEAAQVDVELHYDPIARLFRVVDEDIHDDFPYRYAVSTFDRGFLGNIEQVTYEGTLVKTDVIYPARPKRDASKEVFVVPNPFKRSADWQAVEPRVVFTNLPAECTIRVFTAAAEHVATLHHGPTEPRSTSATSATWNLKTEAGEDIVPGIYIFYVESTGPESFRQTGRMIVVR